MEKSAARRWTRIIALIILLGIHNSCSEENIETETLQEMNLTQNDPEIIKDQYIVLVSQHPAKNDRMAPAALEALSKEVSNMNGAKIKGTFRHSVTGFVARLLPQQVEKLRKDKRIYSITPDRYIEIESFGEADNTISIQEYPTWGLDRMDQREELLDRAYVYSSTGSGVNVYVMDSGIRFTHDEFEQRASLGIDLVKQYPEDWDEDSSSIEDGGDCHGHGTHVAGTVGGKNYGVAKKVDLVSVRVVNCIGRSTWARILLGVEWVTENAVQPAVVNMSLGAPYTSDFDPLALAINNSIATGINYVVAGGNADTSACDFSPARIPDVITVGASTIYNKRASFSNYGSCLDLYAPGLSITSAGIVDDSSIRIWAGTSMAAPHVAGLVALYLEKNPEATPAQVHSAIVDNSTPNLIGEVPSGPANLAHSLWETVTFTPPPAPEINLEVSVTKIKGSHDILLNWNTPEENEHIIYKNGKYFGKVINGYSSFGDYTTLKHATFVYKVCGMAYQNCSQEITVIIGNGAEVEVNSPPTADFTFTNTSTVVNFFDKSTDLDGYIANWIWDFGDGKTSRAQNPKHIYESSGIYTVWLTAVDDGG
ncbi:MAG TPA: S8 family serine peptidase, partial [Gillisia sp.]|nr:S8 family serine peptidase [Gillisia sp.]